MMNQEPPQDVIIIYGYIPYSEELADVYWMLGPASRSKEERMDAEGHIYMDRPEDIPAEDSARLDGYLRARAEADSKAIFEEMRDKLREKDE